MEIKNLFEYKVDRQIPGVVFVQRKDEDFVKQEVNEFVITSEIQQLLRNFYGNYQKSYEYSYSDIGVWVSGFFGSGKSHFLKMLSFLLSNKVIDNKPVLDYFKEKLTDRELVDIVRNFGNEKTESIIFNIDTEGPVDKNDTAILRIFAKVFYNHIGLYGEDERIANFEIALQEVGEYENFKTEWNMLTGDNWVDNRKLFFMKKAKIAEVIASIFNESLEDAKARIDDNAVANLSIKKLANSITTYISKKGEDARLLFFVDEVGQYIDDNTSMMLNLQSIVEELGNLSKGKAWVFVTSQEAIDSTFRPHGHDFSKIQARFKTRLSLSSSSVDEVIKRRILQKKTDQINGLKVLYETNKTSLKNLFTFENATDDITGYSNEKDFVDVYPFVPYQFKLLQNTFIQVRKHGTTGKHLSSGERTMLSGFQEALISVQEDTVNKLVPFSSFFDTMSTFLESQIKQIFVRCEEAAKNNMGLKVEDVTILKLLFLIRYLDDVKPTIENLTVLSIDNIDFDKISKRKNIEESLERLLKQNYISRQGDTYTFLTDDEQYISKEISSLQIENSRTLQEISKIIFDNIFNNAKINYLGRNDFQFRKFIDDFEHTSGSPNLTLKILTNSAFTNQSLLGEVGTATIVLSENQMFFDDLTLYLQTRLFANQNITKLTDAQKTIVQQRQSEATTLYKEITEKINKSVFEGEYYIGTQTIVINGSDTKSKINNLMTKLIDDVYSKNQVLVKSYQNDEEIYSITNKSIEQSTLGLVSESENQDAVNDVLDYIRIFDSQHRSLSMEDIQKRYQDKPYGYKDIDVAGLIAELLQQNIVSLHTRGNHISKSDSKLVDYLRKRTEIANVSIKLKINIDEHIIRNFGILVKDLFDVTNIPTNEDELITFVVNKINAEIIGLRDKESKYQYSKLPQKELVTKGLVLFNTVLSFKHDNTTFIEEMNQKKDELLDWKEDYIDLKGFFGAQEDIYRKANLFIKEFDKELIYFIENENIKQALSEINRILDLEKPYREILNLNELITVINEEVDRVLILKRQETISSIESLLEETLTSIKSQIDNNAFEDLIREDFQIVVDNCKNTKSVSNLNAYYGQAQSKSEEAFRKLRSLLAEEKPETRKLKVVNIKKIDLIPIKTVNNNADIEELLSQIRSKLEAKLAENDSVQIN